MSLRPATSCRRASVPSEPRRRAARSRARRRPRAASRPPRGLPGGRCPPAAARPPRGASSLSSSGESEQELVEVDGRTGAGRQHEVAVQLRRLDQSPHEVVGHGRHDGMMGSMATRGAGWYPTVGRPLLRVAAGDVASDRDGAAGSAAPWPRIGGVSTDPALATDLCGVALRPIGLAAGFDKSCRHLDALGELGFGRRRRHDHSRGSRRQSVPRIARSTPPLDRQRDGARTPAPRRSPPRCVTGSGSGPRFVSLADEDLADAVSSLELLEPLVDGVELNSSCPNVSWGQDRDNEAHLRALVKPSVPGR